MSSLKAGGREWSNDPLTWGPGRRENVDSWYVLKIPESVIGPSPDNSESECAAISNGRPLLPVTCGDLGLTAGEVEEKLKEVFRLAQDWGCIMLLDEADVFLAQRRAYDVERNALVSGKIELVILVKYVPAN